MQEALNRGLATKDTQNPAYRRKTKNQTTHQSSEVKLYVLNWRTHSCASTPVQNKKHNNRREQDPGQTSPSRKRSNPKTGSKNSTAAPKQSSVDDYHTFCSDQTRKTQQAHHQNRYRDLPLP